jgi:hypothetical protein
MTIPRSGSGVLRIFGYIIFVFGALSMAQDVAFQVWYSTLPDMGVVLGDGAITLIGLVAISVAICLRKLEQRIERLENTHTSS